MDITPETAKNLNYYFEESEIFHYPPLRVMINVSFCDVASDRAAEVHFVIAFPAAIRSLHSHNKDRPASAYLHERAQAHKLISILCP